MKLRLCYRSQALQVMNCLLDIVYSSQGGIAVVQHGTATAANLWLAISLPSRFFPGTQEKLSHTYSKCMLTYQHVHCQLVMWLLQAAHRAHTTFHCSLFAVLLLWCQNPVCDRVHFISPLIYIYQPYAFLLVSKASWFCYFVLFCLIPFLFW